MATLRSIALATALATCLAAAGLLAAGRTAGTPAQRRLQPGFVRDPHSASEAAKILSEVRATKDADAAEQRRLDAARGRQLGSAAEPQVGDRGLSPRTFFDEIVERYGAPPRLHQQKYAQGRRLDSETLTEANTQPIRISVNFDTLDEAKVQASPLTRDRYCFRVGDWFRVGAPTAPKPTGNGPDGCTRDAAWHSRDSWCLCIQNDVITQEMYNFVKGAVNEVVNEIPRYLRVKPVQGNLTFTRSEGSYPAMWTHPDYEGEACDANCGKGQHVLVPGSLCDTGVEADAVLSVTMPPPTPGVGGTGTFCASDQNGRPLHLIFAWHQHIPDATFASYNYDYATLRAHYRGLVLHEILHGLGFGTFLWLHSYDSAGNRRHLVEQLRVSDPDDIVYHFLPGTRTSEVAKAHFGCDDESQWKGLPMMGYPPSGRDSHHETRILPEDVMSYGGQDKVSAITLATFEDTGHYLANYSNAGCLHWGRGRGCGFVSSRCVERPVGRLVVGPNVGQDCDRSWSHDDDPESLGRCAAPSCSASATSDGQEACPAECYTGTDAADLACVEPPSGEIEASSGATWVKDLSNTLAQEETTEGRVRALLEAFGPYIVLFGFTFSCGCCLASICCPAGKPWASRRNFYVATTLVLLGGLAIALGGIFLVYNSHKLEGYAATNSILVTAGIGFFTACFASFGIYAVRNDHRWKMRFYFFVGILWLAVFFAASILFTKFVRDVDDMSRASLAQVGESHSGGAWDGHGNEYTQEVYAHMESFACNTYQLCCEPSELLDLKEANGGRRQCTTPHTGTEEDASFVLADPSHKDFCPTISGVHAEFKAAPGICKLLEEVSPDFSLDKCRQDYCTTGLEGYESFISLSVDAFKKNMRWVGGGVGLLAVLMVVQLMNLWRAIGHAKRKAADKAWQVQEQQMILQSIHQQT
mmetsp:Transcript_77437/g.199324  ORF Transcript_77437/g.199324 Transcript_77437/m.199324 type:complete len:926 (+) Transcript_77437:72-2849(+)